MQPFLKPSQDPPPVPNNPPSHPQQFNQPPLSPVLPQNPNPNLSSPSLITSLDHPPNPKPPKPHPYSNHHQLLISLDPPPLNLDHPTPFSPLSSPLPDLRTTDHDSPSAFSPRGSFPLDHIPSSSSLNSNLGSLNRSSPAIERSSFDSSINSQSFQPPCLPLPKRTHPISNIWAQSVDTPTTTATTAPTTTTTTTSSYAGSDLELSSPLLSQPSMVNRRFSHLGSIQPHTQSVIGSPASITDPIGSISLSTDRYRGNLTPTSPLSASFGPNSLPSNFYQTWYDTHLSSEGLLGKDERIGRSKARDIFATARPPGSYRDLSVGSIGSPCSSSARSGIGLSNMSPFTGASLLPPGGSMSFGGSLSNQNLDVGYRSNRGRDSSLGAIGSGRMASRLSIASAAPIGSGLGLASSGSRMLNKGSEYGFVGSVGTDSWLTGGRSLSNDLDEDDELAQPTKSGATSRRHSVSAFTARSLTQGFESVGFRSNNSYNNSSNLDEKRSDRDGTFHPTGTVDLDKDCTKSNGYDMLRRGSAALSEEDLCFTGDFNSLNLDLETQASQEPADRLTFQFNHPNHLSSTRSSHQPYQQSKSNYPSEPNDRSLSHLSNMPWSTTPSSVPQDHPIPGPHINAQFGSGNPARKSSFSAGDPFSASAQASRYFASQVGHTLNFLQDNAPPVGSRFPFCHSGSNLQPLGSISSPSVTTFSASGLLSAPSPHSRQIINPEMESKQMGGPFDSVHPFYSPASSQPHHLGSPISPNFQITSGSSGSYQAPNTPAQLNNLSVSSPRSATMPGPGPNELSELGKGIPLHQIPSNCRLYIVEFKGGRTDLFYWSLQPHHAVENIQKGDLVIVEADRGKDLGKVVHDQISIEEVKRFQKQQVEIVFNQLNNPGASQSNTAGLNGNHLLNSVGLGSSTTTAGELNAQAAPNAANVSRLTKEIHPKKIFSKATQLEIQSLAQKMEEERKALSLCRSKALQRGLKMEITSAEWQWDRRKLTFFFIADKRIDFRDLVKDLFRTWKTRIWMCSVNP